MHRKKAKVVRFWRGEDRDEDVVQSPKKSGKTFCPLVVTERQPRFTARRSAVVNGKTLIPCDGQRGALDANARILKFQSPTGSVMRHSAFMDYIWPLESASALIAIALIGIALFLIWFLRQDGWVLQTQRRSAN